MWLARKVESVGVGNPNSINVIPKGPVEIRNMTCWMKDIYSTTGEWALAMSAGVGLGGLISQLWSEAAVGGWT